MLTLIAIQCDSLCANFGFLKIGLVEYIGVLQTPIINNVAVKFVVYSAAILCTSVYKVNRMEAKESHWCCSPCWCLYRHQCDLPEHFGKKDL